MDESMITRHLCKLFNMSNGYYKINKKMQTWKTYCSVTEQKKTSILSTLQKFKKTQFSYTFEVYEIISYIENKTILFKITRKNSWKFKNNGWNLKKNTERLDENQRNLENRIGSN